VNRPVLITAVAVVVGVLIDLATGYSTFPGYAATLGLVGGAALVFGAKALGGAFVQRSEDYYPEDTPADEQEDLRG
jgi:hypothetical protein